MADETENKSWWEQIIENKNGNTSDSAGISAATATAESAQATAEAAQETAEEALTAASTVASTSSLGVVKVYGTTTSTSNAPVYINTTDNKLCVPQASTSVFGSCRLASSVSNSSATVPTNAAVYSALSAKADATTVPTNADYVDLTSEQTVTGKKMFTTEAVFDGGIVAETTNVNLYEGATIGAKIDDSTLTITSSIKSSGTNTFSGTTTFTGEVHIQDAVSDDSPVTYSQLQALVDRVAALEAAAASE